MIIFIAGIMQGARTDHLIGDQGYRPRITAMCQTHIADVKIHDPWALNPGSVDYTPEQARHTFITNVLKTSETDVVIAYLPSASMGTAMEMWEAYRNQVPVVTVSPLVHNWSIRFTSQAILPDLDALEAFIAAGKLPTVEWAA